MRASFRTSGHPEEHSCIGQTSRDSVASSPAPLHSLLSTASSFLFSVVLSTPIILMPKRRAITCFHPRSERRRKLHVLSILARYISTSSSDATPRRPHR